ncbi:hypothetical protein Pan44_00910 [Caulifigura coniformis]|uniref:Uncharacterized protein n=1 Tax=Caulifigura coniformis TaxID=2527983 RepID=A0A517S7J9_9PLAN|nr:DUF3239 domain-containing protein [Caulifigura coniformis]QDT52083.1 hypothetical protein Pan44_00910 [Caulifigura coniformis]
MAGKKALGEASEIVNDSMAGRALNRNPSLLRALLYEPTLKLLAIIGVIVFLVGMAFGVTGEAVEKPGPAPGALSTTLTTIGGLVLLLSFGIGLLTFVVWKAIKRNFANGLISAGMILEEKPLTMIVLANIGTGESEKATWGAIRFSPGALPGHDIAAHEKVPCICTFKPSEEFDHWGDVQPMPVCHGRGGKKLLAEVNDIIGEREYKILRSMIQKGWIPEDDEHMVVIEEGGAPRTVERAAVTERKQREAAREASTGKA